MTEKGTPSIMSADDAMPRPTSTGVAFWDRFAFVYDAATRSGDAGLDQAAAFVSRFVGRHGVVLEIKTKHQYNLTIAPAGVSLAA